jgi:hypothetical protein
MLKRGAGGNADGGSSGGREGRGGPGDDGHAGGARGVELAGLLKKLQGERDDRDKLVDEFLVTLKVSQMWYCNGACARVFLVMLFCALKLVGKSDLGWKRMVDLFHACAPCRRWMRRP